VNYPRGHGVEAQYGGIPSAKLSRLSEKRRKDPEAFLEETPGNVLDALRQYESANAQDQHKAVAELAIQKARVLPTPPEGYSWRRDPSGPAVTGHVTFRLWNDDLGEMPSEGEPSPGCGVPGFSSGNDGTGWRVIFLSPGGGAFLHPPERGIFSSLQPGFLVRPPLREVLRRCLPS